MPPIEDQVPLPAADNPNPDPVVAEAPALEAPAPEAPEPPAIVDPRAEIARRFQERRREQDADVAFDADYTPPFAQEKPVEAPAEPEVPAEPETPKSYTLRVNRNDVTLTREQLLRVADIEPDEAASYPESTILSIARKQLAAEAYLDEAKQAAKQNRTATPRPAPDESGNDEPTGEAPQPGDLEVDPVFADAIEKIQYGDPKEGAIALQSAIKAANERERTARLHALHSLDVRTTLEAFAQKNPDLAEDRDLSSLMLNRITEEVREELIKAGADREEAEQVITTPDIAGQAYVAARLRGVDLRRPADIIESAASHIRTRFAPGAAPQQTPQPAQDAVAARVELKRAAPQQPTRSSAPPPVAARQGGEAGRSSVVENMRRQRGFTS